VYEKRVLRRVSGPMRGKVIGGFRKCYHEELYNSYSLPNIIRMIKQRRARWGGHAVPMGK
jgi:hypothetical protein